MDGNEDPAVSSTRPTSRRRLFVLLLALAIAGLGGLFYVLVLPVLVDGRIRSNENSAIEMLRALVKAQDLWRSNDVDGNGIQDYWVADVAGLYALDVDGRGPVKQIPFDIAQADPVGAPRYPRVFPQGAVPYNGYYVQTFARLEQGVEPGERNTRRFAYQAYPAEYGWVRRNMFIISESGSLWRSDASGQGVSTGGERYTPIELLPADLPRKKPR